MTWLKRFFLWLLRIALFAYVALMIFGQFFSGWMVYPHPKSSYSTLPGLVWISAEDGTRLAADWRPNLSARWTILYLHGNGEDLGLDQGEMNYLVSLGASVLAYDYRGYGLSEGSPSEAHLLDDVQSVYGYLLQQQHVDPRKLVVWGRSLGSGSAAFLASHHPVGALILESAYTSLFQIVVPWLWFPNDQFRSLSCLRSVTCPVLVIHGTEDQVVPFWMGKKLYQAAQGPKSCLWVTGAGHNNVMDLAGPRYSAAVVAFLAKVSP